MGLSWSCSMFVCIRTLHITRCKNNLHGMQEPISMSKTFLAIWGSYPVLYGNTMRKRKLLGNKSSDTARLTGWCVKQTNPEMASYRTKSIICLSIWPSVRFFTIRPFDRPSVHPTICSSIRLSVHTHRSFTACQFIKLNSCLVLLEFPTPLDIDAAVLSNKNPIIQSKFKDWKARPDEKNKFRQKIR